MRRRLTYVAVFFVVAAGCVSVRGWGVLEPYLPWHEVSAEELSKMHGSLLMALDLVTQEAERSRAKLQAMSEPLSNSDRASFVGELSARSVELEQDCRKAFKACKRAVRLARRYERLTKDAPERLRRSASRLRDRSKEQEFLETKDGYQTLSESLDMFAVDCDLRKDEISKATKELVSIGAFQKETEQFVEDFSKTVKSLPDFPQSGVKQGLLGQLRSLEARFSKVANSVSTYRSVVGEPQTAKTSRSPPIKGIHQSLQ